MLRSLSVAVDIMKGDFYATLTKVSLSSSFTRVTKPHTSADNMSVVQVPVVITHSSPRSVVEHLHSALPIRTATDKSHVFQQNDKNYMNIVLKLIYK